MIIWLSHVQYFLLQNTVGVIQYVAFSDFIVVQLFTRVWLFATPQTAARQASLSVTISWNLLKLMSIESVMPSNHLILCWPLFLLPSVFPSISVFSNESALCIRWPKYWSFSFSISPSNEYSRLISFRNDWFDLLAVQRTLKSLLQHHNSKASVLWHSAFFFILASFIKQYTFEVLSCPFVICKHFLLLNTTPLPGYTKVYL